EHIPDPAANHGADDTEQQGSQETCRLIARAGHHQFRQKAGHQADDDPGYPVHTLSPPGGEIAASDLYLYQVSVPTPCGERCTLFVFAAISLSCRTRRERRYAIVKSAIWIIRRNLRLSYGDDAPVYVKERPDNAHEKHCRRRSWP